MIDAVDLFYRALKILKNRYQGYNINRDYNFQPPVKCTDSNYVSSHNGTIMMGILKDVSINAFLNRHEKNVDWLQSLKQFFINVSFHILVASLTLMALSKTAPSALYWLQVYDMKH